MTSMRRRIRIIEVVAPHSPSHSSVIPQQTHLNTLCFGCVGIPLILPFVTTCEPCPDGMMRPPARGDTTHQPMIHRPCSPSAWTFVMIYEHFCHLPRLPSMGTLLSIPSYLATVAYPRAQVFLT